jgi:hypothetical protein
MAALPDETTQDPPSLARTASEPLPVDDAAQEATPPSKKRPRAPKTKADKPKKEKAESDAGASPKPPKRVKRPANGPTSPEDPPPDQDSKPVPTKSKRGQARPHRRLDSGTIVARIEKLDKRIRRAQSQLTEATRHVQGYRREMTFRPDWPSVDPAKEDKAKGEQAKGETGKDETGKDETGKDEKSMEDQLEESIEKTEA